MKQPVKDVRVTDFSLERRRVLRAQAEEEALDSLGVRAPPTPLKLLNARSHFKLHKGSGNTRLSAGRTTEVNSGATSNIQEFSLGFLMICSPKQSMVCPLIVFTYNRTDTFSDTVKLICYPGSLGSFEKLSPSLRQRHLENKPLDKSYQWIVS